MAHNALKLTFVALGLLSIQLISTALGGYTLGKDARARLDRQFFYRLNQKWVAQISSQGVDHKMFLPQRGVIEGLGVSASLAIRFPPPASTHGFTNGGPQIDINKQTIVFLVQNGGNSLNAVIGGFYYWLKGGQVVFWRARGYTPSEQQAKDDQDAEDAKTDAEGAARKKLDSNRVEEQVNDLLAMLESHGVPVLKQITGSDSNPHDIEKELAAFEKFKNIAAVDNGMLGQGRKHSEILPKVYMGLEVLKELVTRRQVKHLEVDVLSCGENLKNIAEFSKLDTGKHAALDADRARLLPKPYLVTPVNGFTEGAYENTVKGVEFHVVVPGYINAFTADYAVEEGDDEYDYNRADMVNLRKLAPSHLNYKEILVDIKHGCDTRVMKLLSTPHLYRDFAKMKELSELFTITETDYKATTDFPTT